MTTMYGEVTDVTNDASAELRVTTTVAASGASTLATLPTK